MSQNDNQQTIKRRTSKRNSGVKRRNVLQAIGGGAAASMFTASVKAEDSPTEHVIQGDIEKKTGEELLEIVYESIEQEDVKNVLYRTT